MSTEDQEYRAYMAMHFPTVEVKTAAPAVPTTGLEPPAAQPVEPAPQGGLPGQGVRTAGPGGEDREYRAWMSRFMPNGETR